MADVPVGVAYGTVRWYAGLFTADSPDPGTVPDNIPMTGTVTITPLVGRTRYPTLPVPMTAFLQPAVCPVVDGWLCGPLSVVPDVVMVSSFQVNADVHTVQYQATFNMDDVPKANQPPPLVFEIPVSGVVDLSTILPQAATPPVVYVVDDTIRVAAEAAAVSAANSAAEAQQALDDLLIGVGPAVEDYLAANPPSMGTIVVADLSDAQTPGKNLLLASTQALARAAIGAGTSTLAVGSTAGTAKSGDWFPQYTEIVGTTAIGQSLMSASSQANARTAIGAGTSSLALGGSGVATTAMRSDWRPTATTTDLLGATAVGISVLTAPTQAAARTAIGAGTGSSAGGVYVYHWNGTIWVDGDNVAEAVAKPTGAIWRVYLGPAAPITPPAWTNVPSSYFYWVP